MARAQQPTPGSPADLQVEADPHQVARTILLRRLTAAPRTRSELREDLLGRGIPEEVAEQVLDRFVEVGLIDDELYARMWVDSRHRTRGTARSVLRQELRHKGIDGETAEQALEQIDAHDERQRALTLVHVKLRGMSRLDPAVRKRRLVSLLQRRGYSAGLAYAVVREVIGESDPAEEWAELSEPAD